MTGRRSLPKYARLRRSSEIRSMFRSGRRRSCAMFDVYTRPTAGARSSRLGVVVPKHGRTIVQRNQLERRIRELLRTEWLPGERSSAETWDLLVRARPVAYETSGAELREELRGCLGIDGS